MKSSDAMNLFGVHLMGATQENGRKLLLTLAFVAMWFAILWALRTAVRLIGEALDAPRFRFWVRQIVSIVFALVLVVGVISIWFDDPTKLTTALGLVTAGIAFALQRVITAIAGYIIILRGKTFNVGDRIVMGGVRGDVISLSFMQTKIMEMGEPPPVADADPPVWVHSRQFTGRIVTVSNDKIFDEPVFNYTYRFPYLWEEMRLPIAFRDDRHKAEEIMLDAARKQAVHREHLTQEQVEELERRYQISVGDIEPRVYWRITDNWMELTVRFMAPDHGSRAIKDAMSREIMAAFDKAGIGIASGTYEIVGLPPIQVKIADQRQTPPAPVP